jgi:hypothetical protein
VGVLFGAGAALDGRAPVAPGEAWAGAVARDAGAWRGAVGSGREGDHRDHRGGRGEARESTAPARVDQPDEGAAGDDGHDAPKA